MRHCSLSLIAVRICTTLSLLPSAHAPESVCPSRRISACSACPGLLKRRHTSADRLLELGAAVYFRKVYCKVHRMGQAGASWARAQRHRIASAYQAGHGPASGSSTLEQLEQAQVSSGGLRRTQVSMSDILVHPFLPDPCSCVALGACGALVPPPPVSGAELRRRVRCRG